MIEAKHISYKIADKYLIRDVSLRANAGEVLAIVGANGAGKSTLLKVMAGSLQPSDGLIILNQKALPAWKQADLAKVRGVLSQLVHLSFPMTALEIVTLGRYAYHGQETSAQSRRIAKWALEQVQMQTFANRSLLTLSGGEQQRVHLARVLAQIHEKEHRATKYLMLDEPVSSLDIAQQHHLLSLVRNFSRSLGLGVLVIIHDMNLAAQYADRIIMLKKGKIIESGVPEKVFVPETISEVFGIQSIITQHPVYNCPQVTAIFDNINKQQYSNPITLKL